MLGPIFGRAPFEARNGREPDVADITLDDGIDCRCALLVLPSHMGGEIDIRLDKFDFSWGIRARGPRDMDDEGRPPECLVEQGSLLRS